MLRSPWTRTLVAVLALAGLVGAGVWFGSLSPAPELGDYPGEPQLDADYDRYVGDRVVVSGAVVETDPVVVRAGYPGGEIRLTVDGLARGVDRGDFLWVYAVVEPDRHVRAVDAVVIPPAGFRYAKGISVLAGLWVLARILRDWRLDRSAWGLVPDGHGRWPARITGPLQRGGDGDA